MICCDHQRQPTNVQHKHAYSVALLQLGLTHSIILDVKPGHNDRLRTAVDAIVREALSHRSPGKVDREEGEEHGTLVHCGRTKVFLTQYMVRLVYTHLPLPVHDETGLHTPSSPST